VSYKLKVVLYFLGESLLFERSDPPWMRRDAGAFSNFFRRGTARFFDGSPLRLLFYRLKKPGRRSGMSPSGLKTCIEIQCFKKVRI
jgi:hypothetical protein